MLVVKDIMTHPPKTVSPDTSLQQVVEMMQADGFRQLPVLENDRLIGIITERDIRVANDCVEFDVKTAVSLPSNLSCTVRSCMTPDPITVSVDTPAYRAAEMMSLFKFSALIVVQDEAVVGIISVSDFLGIFPYPTMSKLRGKPS